MRWLAPVIYAVFLLIGAYFVENRGLRVSHTIVASDNLQYTTRALQAGEVIKPGDLSALPPLTPEEGVTPVVFTVAAKVVQSGVVSAGGQVRVCKGGTMAFKGVPVKAVLCPPQATACLAVIGIPDDPAGALAGLFRKAPFPTLEAAGNDSSATATCK
jgi:hypothetical protein